MIEFYAKKAIPDVPIPLFFYITKYFSEGLFFNEFDARDPKRIGARCPKSPLGSEATQAERLSNSTLGTRNRRIGVRCPKPPGIGGDASTGSGASIKEEESFRN